MVICVILALAIGVPNGFFGGNDVEDLNDDDTPGISDVLDGETPLLMFDKSREAKTLMEAMEEDRVVSVNLLYDQGGGNPEMESSDPDIIKRAYKATKNITVRGDEEVNMSVTDAYHHVYFTLDDGSQIGYSFEGEKIIFIHDGTAAGSPHLISGSRELWSLYRELAGN